MRGRLRNWDSNFAVYVIFTCTGTKLVIFILREAKGILCNIQKAMELSIAQMKRERISTFS